MAGGGRSGGGDGKAEARSRAARVQVMKEPLGAKACGPERRVGVREQR